ncbi:hypothetical protein [Actinomadura harenae]|uniref:hypothetical protein n=1 Tax=Actinomadura harenae TaxID=2483351 RepID=UPI0011C44E2B|nr:hypothetical protein [Actinomadura harenae]
MAPDRAPVGDIAAALTVLDTRLKSIGSGEAAGEDELRSRYLESFGPLGAAAVLDGACTLIYVYMQWLEDAYSSQDEDVMEHVVPWVLGTMKLMKVVDDEGIPTMAALLVAPVVGISPTLWRREHGPWRKEEMTALEVAMVLLGLRVNELTGDDDSAVRLITDLLDQFEADDEAGDEADDGA